MEKIGTALIGLAGIIILGMLSYLSYYFFAKGDFLWGFIGLLLILVSVGSGLIVIAHNRSLE